LRPALRRQSARVPCRFIPSYLAPADVERMARHLGYVNIGEFAFENLLASVGATVMNAEGRVFQIPTLVPQRKADSPCKFLDAAGRCSIHAVSPYGCAMFDAHQLSEEADRRSSRGYRRSPAIGRLAPARAPTPSSGSCSTRSACASRRRTSPEWRWKKPSAERRLPILWRLSFRIKWREL